MGYCGTRNKASTSMEHSSPPSLSQILGFFFYESIFGRRMRVGLLFLMNILNFNLQPIMKGCDVAVMVYMYGAI